MSLCYLVASQLGKAQVVFSVVFLTSLFLFANTQSRLALSLLVFWGIYLAIWPLGLPQLISGLRTKSTVTKTVLGYLDRIDSPNIARVALVKTALWPNADTSVEIHLHDGSAKWGIPLFRENRSDGAWATILITDHVVDSPGKPGSISLPSQGMAGPTCSDLSEALAGAKNRTLVGVVRESSNLLRLRDCCRFS